MHVYTGEKVVFAQIKGLSTSIPLRLYLDVGDSDQATSGCLWMPTVGSMLQLAPTQGISYCHRDPDPPLPCNSSLLYRGPHGLSHARFCEGAELIVWPDPVSWEGKFSS